MTRVTLSALCCAIGLCLLSSASARAEDEAPASEPASSQPQAAGPQSQPAEIPPELLEFLTAPGVATTLIFAVDAVARPASAAKGALSGALTGCLVGAATPVALSLLSPLLGGPRFDFAEIGGPWWAMLPGAAIGATALAPLWAAGEGLEYERERRTFLRQVFPQAGDDDVPAVIYRDAATAAALGVVSAALPLGAGIGLMYLGGANPGSAWQLGAIPFFAGALLVAPTVTASLYPEYTSGRDPFVQASRETSEAQIREFVELMQRTDEDEAED